MHGYSGFITDVENAFQWLIDDYSPKISKTVDSSFGEYAIEIRLKKCIILFDLDRMDLQGKFINPTTRKQYHIKSVLELLRGKNIQFPSGMDKVGQIRALLKEYSEVVQLYLQEVVNGDFSWVITYDEKENRERSLVAKVWKLPYESPIYQKFISGDSSWKDDIIDLNK